MSNHGTQLESIQSGVKASLAVNDPNFKVKVGEDFAEGRIQTVEDVQLLYGVTRYQALTLMSDPIVIECMRKVTQAKLQLAYNTKVVDIVVEALESEDPKDRMAAAKMIGQMSGNMKTGNGAEVNVNIGSVPSSLEDVVKATPKSSTLNKMFEQDVIDIKVEG